MGNMDNVEVEKGQDKEENIEEEKEMIVLCQTDIPEDVNIIVNGVETDCNDNEANSDNVIVENGTNSEQYIEEEKEILVEPMIKISQNQNFNENILLSENVDNNKSSDNINVENATNPEENIENEREIIIINRVQREIR